MYAKALSGLVEKPRDLPADTKAASTPSDLILREWELVQRAQTLDEGALASLYSTFYPRIYNYVFLHLGDVQTAEDLVSEVMLKVLESIKKYQFKGTPFSAWVFRIARNKLIDLQAGWNAGCRAALVLTGHGEGTRTNADAEILRRIDCIAHDLSRVADWLLKRTLQIDDVVTRSLPPPISVAVALPSTAP